MSDTKNEVALHESVDQNLPAHPDMENAEPWWRQPGLRQLYCLMPFLFLGSTTLGYDGSLLNGLQTMETWQDCEY